MSIIQTSYGTPHAPGSFFAVHHEGNQLVLYERNNSAKSNKWKRGKVISSKATATGSLIQSSYSGPFIGNFEAVVLEGNKLVHYYRDNSSGGSDTWNSHDVITSKATGAGCIIQTSYSTPASHGDFAVVVPEGNDLVQYYRDNSHLGRGEWKLSAVITSKATGPGSIIQSSYSTPYSPGNYEVVVPEGKNLIHYTRDNCVDGGGRWNEGTVITSHATGGGSIVQNTFSTPNGPGNFDVVALEGSELVQYYRDFRMG
jgi:hypothetical protein